MTHKEEVDDQKSMTKYCIHWGVDFRHRENRGGMSSEGSFDTL